MSRYNVFIKNFVDTLNLVNIEEDDVKSLVEAYDFGKKSVFINGERIVLDGLDILKIFKFNGETSDFYQLLNSPEVKPYLIFSRIRGIYAMDYREMNQLGEEVTKIFLKGSYGWKTEIQSGDNILMLRTHFVNLERIAQLKSLHHPDFDLKKLVRICEEINISYNLDCFYAVGNLLRAILDHVPPIFGYNSFKEVANNYAGSKSFKESVQNLESFLRKISDGFLHQVIRNNEVLPTGNQVEFKAPIDLLLSEIVRLTESKSQK